MGWLGDLIGNSAGEIINSITDGVDKFVTSDKEKQELALMKSAAELKFKQLEFDAENAYIQDRQSARNMYMKDSSLQKIFAIVFLVFYCVISMGMIGMVISMAFFSKTIPLPEWGVMLITSVFTGMSVKVNTIVDFLFGGSKQRDDSDSEVAKSFQKGNMA
jgi:hypothetical protein